MTSEQLTDVLDSSVFPYYLQKAVDLGLLKADGAQIVACNKPAVEKVMEVARIVDRLQPTSVQEREDTTAQEAIVISRVLASPSGVAREMWSEFRTGMGMGHGQTLPKTLWSDSVLRAIATEIDLVFLGERNTQVISRESLITSYTKLNQSSRTVPVIDFSKTITELGDPETLAKYGEQKSEWATAIDILKQVRVRAMYIETLHAAKQNIKADLGLENALEFLQSRAMEGVGMMRGSVGNQGRAVEIVDAIIGSPGDNRANWIDRLSFMTKRLRPASTGFPCFDLDMDGGVYPPTSNAKRGGRLFTIAARTSVGKTIIGCAIASKLASNGLTVGFVSAELDTNAIEARILASLSKLAQGDMPIHWKGANNYLGYITVGELEEPELDDRDHIKMILANIASQLQTNGGKFLVEAPWGACVDSAINSMRTMKAKHPELRAVVLDHFHVLARHKGAPRDSSAMLEERAYKLTTAAKELDIDLFVLAQMNQIGIKVARSNMKPDSQMPPPELDEIRGTDALSHVSHAVWMVRKAPAREDSPNERLLQVWHSKVRGRQAFWEGDPPNEKITTVKGFVDLSVIQLDYQTSTLKSDNTLQHPDAVRSKRYYR